MSILEMEIEPTTEGLGSIRFSLSYSLSSVWFGFSHWENCIHSIRFVVALN